MTCGLVHAYTRMAGCETDFLCTLSIFLKKVMPGEKVLFLFYMKGIPNKKNINNKNLLISKIPKKKKQKKQGNLLSRSLVAVEVQPDVFVKKRKEETLKNKFVNSL